MNHEEHCDALENDAHRLASLLSGADAEAAVPTCPGWNLGELTEHVGGLYRWSAAHVAASARSRIDHSALDLGPPAERATPAWLASGIAPMLDTFRASDPEATVWGWGADRHNRFWPRRMLFETVVHRADAAFAHGGQPDIDPAVAVDGIDELLANLPHAAYFAPGIADLRGDGERIALRSADADRTWMVRLLPAGYAWDWSSGRADVTVDAPAADLLLLLYGRRTAGDAARFTVEGDGALLGRFVTAAAL